MGEFVEDAVAARAAGSKSPIRWHSTHARRAKVRSTSSGISRGNSGFGSSCFASSPARYFLCRTSPCFEARRRLSRVSRCPELRFPAAVAHVDLLVRVQDEEVDALFQSRSKRPISTSSMRVTRTQTYSLNTLPSGRIFRRQHNLCVEIRPSIQASQRNSRKIGFWVRFASSRAFW